MEWTPIHFSQLVRAVNHGWTWKKNGRRLQLVSPLGDVWDFKMQGRLYVRPEKSDPADERPSVGLSPLSL